MTFTKFSWNQGQNCQDFRHSYVLFIPCICSLLYSILHSFVYRQINVTTLRPSVFIVAHWKLAFDNNFHLLNPCSPNYTQLLHWNFSKWQRILWVINHARRLFFVVSKFIFLINSRLGYFPYFQLYAQSIGRLKLDKRLSVLCFALAFECWLMKLGILQGCPLSSVPFNFVIGCVVKRTLDGY